MTVTGTRAGAAADYEQDLSPLRLPSTRDAGRQAVDDLAAATEQLDVLVNNAGANFPDGKDEWDPDGFSAALDLNVEGAMRLTTGLRPAAGRQHASTGAPAWSTSSR